MRRPATLFWFSLGLFIVAATWPWWFAYRLNPLSSDAVQWMLAGRPWSSGWAEWTFATKHFHVAYRPLTALSFSANALMGGLDPLAYRVTDLVLHGLVAALLCAVFLRLTPDRTPRWAGAVAAAAYLLHPIHEHIVPHLARRSYPLAAVLALAGLLALLPPPGRSWNLVRAAVASVLLPASMLANETAALVLAAAPFLVWNHTGSLRVAIWRSLGPVGVAIGVLGLRTAVIGGSGGYPGNAGPLEIAAFNANGLLALVPMTHRGETPGWVWAWVAVVVPWLTWRVAWVGLQERATARGRLPAALMLWVGGLTVLVASQGVWFPRQVHPLVLPFALLVATLASDQRLPARGLGWALLGWIALSSPVVNGVDPLRKQHWENTSAMVDHVVHDVRRVPRGSRVYLALPKYRRPILNTRRARQTRRGRRIPISLRWVRARTGRRAVLKAWAQYNWRGEGAQLDEDGGIFMPARTVWRAAPNWTATRSPAPARIASPLPPPHRPGFVYVYDGEHGTMLPLEPPEDTVAQLAALQTPEARPPNILFVVWDTVRRDHLGVYGHPHDATPFLDQWATEARVYDDCVSISGNTVPSHASMFTGLIPSQHGAHNRYPRLDANFDTLAELLAAEGYATWAYTANPYLDQRRGLLQGFAEVRHPWDDQARARALVDAKVDPEDYSHELARKINRGKRGGVPVTKAGALSVEAADGWLESHGEQPFFLFVNLMEAHRPLIPTRASRERLMTPEEIQAGYAMDRTWDAVWSYTFGLSDYTPEELAVLRKHYDASLTDLDDVFAGLVGMLEARGLADDTLVVLTSDHGEHLGENHMLDHQYSLANTLLDVPLIVRYPEAFPPGHDDAPVSNLDLFPTLLNVAGVARPPGMPPTAAVDLREATGPRPRIAEYPRAMPAGMRRVARNHPEFDSTPFDRALQAWVTPSHKLVRASDGRHALYASADRAEREDLAARSPETVDALSTDLDRFLAELEMGPAAAQAELRMSGAERAALQALGYLNE